MFIFHLNGFSDISASRARAHIRTHLVSRRFCGMEDQQQRRRRRQQEDEDEETPQRKYYFNYGESTQ